MSLGEKIKYYRKKEKLTQEALAKKTNISRSYLADVERDRYNPSLETLKRIANSLEIPLTSLMGYDYTENEVYVKEDDDYRTLARYGRKMTPEQRKKAIKILEATFEELFDDED